MVVVVAENPLPTRVTPRLATSPRQELPKGGWGQREGGHSPCAPSTPTSLNYARQMIDRVVTTWRQCHNLESFCSVDEAARPRIWYWAEPGLGLGPLGPLCGSLPTPPSCPEKVSPPSKTNCSRNAALGLISWYSQLLCS